MIKSHNGKLQNSHLSAEVVFAAELFPDLIRAKSRDRAVSILEAAISSYRTRGIENTTYDVIASSAGISRPLIFKYFKDYEEIFYKAVKLIRVHFQMFAVEAIRQHQTPTKKMHAYVQSTFDWLETYPSYASGLLLYLQRCSWNERDRDLNTQFTEAGRVRIAALVRLGVEAGEFHCSDPDVTAKQIQTVITGAVVTLLSEGLPEKARFHQETRDLCLKLVGLQPYSE